MCVCVGLFLSVGHMYTSAIRSKKRKSHVPNCRSLSAKKQLMIGLFAENDLQR